MFLPNRETGIKHEIDMKFLKTSKNILTQLKKKKKLNLEMLIKMTGSQSDNI